MTRSAAVLTISLGCLSILSCTKHPAAAADVPAQPRGVTLQNLVSFYDVTGTTPDEMHAAIVNNGPRVDDVPVFGLTEWEVRWRLRPLARTGECRLGQAEVLLTIRTSLPRWKSATGAPTKLRTEWRYFEDAVTLHERGHRDLGIRAAAAIAEALRRRREYPARTCELVLNEANATAQRVLREYHDKNVEYDRVTMHGVTQGVDWPPPTRRN